MFVPKTAKDFQDKMDQFKKAAAGFKGKVGDNVFFVLSLYVMYKI